MRAVRELARPVALDDGIEAIKAGEQAPFVAITFDDAFRNFVEVAWPVMADLEIPVTLFVPTGFVVGAAPSPLSGVDLPPCDWPALRDLIASSLVTIGSHTRTHPDLRRLDVEQVRAELQDSRSTLEDHLGVAVNSFCYPRALWNRRVESEVARVYDLAVVGGGRRNLGRTPPLRLSRTSIRAGATFRIAEWIASSVWLEEAVADVVRRLR